MGHPPAGRMASHGEANINSRPEGQDNKVN